MFWMKEDGIAVADMITLFTLVGIMTFSALPFYNNLITQTHRLEVETTYNRIKTSIIMSTIDSLSANGIANFQFTNNLSRNYILNSSNWEHDGIGTWTYHPTGVQIIYSRLERNDFSLIIKYN